MPTVLLSPNSSRLRRDWPVNQYIKVCKALVARGFQILLTGASNASEASYGPVISSKCNHKSVRDLTGKTDLEQLYALIASVDLVIAPDSGPLHMANTAGTTCVGLYAGSNPARTGPYHYQDLVVNKYPQAVEKFLGKKCREVKWGKRVNHPEVMKLIQVGDVMEKIDDAMNRISV